MIPPHTPYNMRQLSRRIDVSLRTIMRRVLTPQPNLPHLHRHPYSGWRYTTELDVRCWEAQQPQRS
jgi:hypothetical protein